MLARLDHLVLLVRDLGEAALEHERLGFTVTPGGEHADGLTRNALIPFADGSYVELIAFLDPEDPTDNVWNWRPFAALGGGLIDYCAASDDLDGDVRRLRAEGFEVDDPTSGGRTLPGGEEILWRVARIRQEGRVLPFLIEDQTPRGLRVPSGPAAAHPNGARGISRLEIAAPDAEEAADSYASLTGASHENGLRIGSCAVEIVDLKDGSRAGNRQRSPRAGPLSVILDAGGTKVIRLPAR
ncbi:MAG TPA: VOC family protein [Rubrobacteraceae bacterium]|nr:VOC family protein [Rubrobacteraceae bacterium]